jgi:hypothetical protein
VRERQRERESERERKEKMRGSISCVVESSQREID